MRNDSGVKYPHCSGGARLRRLRCWRPRLFESDLDFGVIDFVDRLQVEECIFEQDVIEMAGTPTITSGHEDRSSVLSVTQIQAKEEVISEFREPQKAWTDQRVKDVYRGD